MIALHLVLLSLLIQADDCWSKKEEEGQIDGGWSAWKPAACQRGETQHRECNNPTPTQGGKKCNGPKVRACPRCEWSDLCQNGGTCIVGTRADQYTCVCMAGYTGVNCEILVPCPTPSLAHNISVEGYVFVTTLGDEVFAVTIGDAITVYDAETMTSKRNLSVNGLVIAGSIAADTRDNLLYVSSIGNGKVLKFEPSNGNVVLELDVGDKPVAIAINSERNLIVNLRGESKIKEYTPEGSLVREVPAPDLFVYDIAQLPNGNFLVINANLHDYLLEINSNGEVVKSNEGAPVMFGGLQFHILHNGYIIVLQFGQVSKVLILNPSLTASQELPVPGLKLFVPLTVRVDESRGRVYIGDYVSLRKGHLVVLENVIGRCLAF